MGELLLTKEKNKAKVRQNILLLNTSKYGKELEDELQGVFDYLRRNTNMYYDHIFRCLVSGLIYSVIMCIKCPTA